MFAQKCAKQEIDPCISQEGRVVRMIENIDLLRNKMVDFIQNELLPYEREHQIDSEKDIPREAVDWVRKKSIQFGFHGINLPKELGGQEISLKALCTLKEELIRSGSALWGFVLGDNGGILRVGSMMEHFSPELKEKYVNPVMNGEMGCCFALTEPGVGSDVRTIQTTAVRDGDEYIINGKKHFISSSVYADYAIVIAKEITEEGKEQTTAFIVDRKTAAKPGFELGEIQVTLAGDRSTAELIFDNCRVPAANIIGEPGKGLMLGLGRVSQNRAQHGIAYIAYAERALDLAIQYAKKRVQFGRTIGEFQAIQHMLADMATEIYAARCMVYDAIEKIDNGQLSRSKSSMVKLFASEVAGRVVDKAVQIYGGQGVMKGHPIEKLYRRVRMFRILSGTSEIQRNTIAKEVLNGELPY